MDRIIDWCPTPHPSYQKDRRAGAPRLPWLWPFTSDVPTVSTAAEGVGPGEFYRWCSWPRRLSPPFLGLVTLPTWLSGREERLDLHKPRRVRSAEQAEYILRVLYRRLSRRLDRLTPRGNSRSHWSRYTREHSYAPDDFRLKEQFVQVALDKVRPRRVLDVGCNTGHFSLLAARSGASVVAIDSDPAVLGGLCRRARAEGLAVLPLVQNLAMPSPPVGWRNRECLSFLSRAQGKFDLVLVLALVHHMLVTDGVPLEEIVDLVADLTTEWAIVEFVPPGDAMFKKLSRGRDSLYRNLDEKVFERACRRRFSLRDSRRLGKSRRRLYLLRFSGGKAR